ncbi:MAG: hypothetical protein ABSA07_07390 [Acidimicrobiales bacterium]
MAERSSRRRPFNVRYLAIALVVVIIAATVLIGVTLTSSSPLPVLNASYKCVPGPLIPQLKPGQSGTINASYGSFTATFRATVPAKTPAHSLNVGTPFKGTLTMIQGGTSWTLPRPANPNVAQINVMCVIAFQRETHPGVLVEGFTGGAHCCEVPVIYLFNQAQNQYVKVVDMSPKNYKDPHAFDPNEGFIPKVVGDQVLLTTGDGQFNYAFACYACEVLPVVLDSVGTGGVTDVTPQHPSLVAADAAQAWKYALEALEHEGPTDTFPPPFGYLAPWVADECVLGRGALAWRKIEQLQRAGKLSNALYQDFALNHLSFVANLHTFLLRNDYCTGQI